MSSRRFANTSSTRCAICRARWNTRPLRSNVEDFGPRWYAARLLCEQPDFIHEFAGGRAGRCECGSSLDVVGDDFTVYQSLLLPAVEFYRKRSLAGGKALVADPDAGFGRADCWLDRPISFRSEEHTSEL